MGTSIAQSFLAYGLCIINSMMLTQVIRKIRLNGHYFLTAVLLVSLVPVFRIVHLPLSFTWHRLVPLYWVGLTLHATFAAAVLALIGLPASITVKPLWARFLSQKSRLLIFCPFVIWVFWRFNAYIALLWIAAAIVSTELYDRCHGQLSSVGKVLLRVLPASAYFFAGLLLIFAYNDAIAAVKDPAAYDWLFLKMDSYLLHGRAVSDFVREASPRLSPRTFAFAETMYYRMFDQVGAAILLVSVCQGAKRGLRLVGTMLTAYYGALLLFYLWPSMGPFYTCPDHFTHFPHWLQTYEFQRNLAGNAKLLSGPDKGLLRISTDYFIAFPSLHIALPIIVLWFTRHWKRMFYVLLAYDVILIPAILLLEWHYVVDLIGGALVAGIAILVNNCSRDGNDEARTEVIEGLRPIHESAGAYAREKSSDTTPSLV
jgi:PAP2 superfamily protein